MSETYHTLTANGANSLNSTSNNIVDYFMMFMRGLSKNDNNKYLEKCWKDSPVKTVAIIFNGRDRLNGKKEKKVSCDAMLWLSIHKPYTYKLNIINYINNYGCWKDLLYISYYTNYKTDNYKELSLFAEQLIKDKESLEKNDKVSLCAKWSPSENDRNDKRKHFAKKIASIIYGRSDEKKMEKYRNEYLVPLRKKINIVEKLMCSNEWDKIKYENVPGVASKRLLNAFMKNDGERYTKYLQDVRNGVKEIKITGILPHELSKYYIDLIDEEEYKENETIELQWKAIVENVKKSGTFCNSISIIDVSGSMFSSSNGSIPAQVAISLGVITSICCEGMFKNKFITFSESPELISLIPDEKFKYEPEYIPSLFESYKALKNINCGYSTDFVKCCEKIINFGNDNNIQDEDMPKKLFVFTDMQFDNVSTDNEKMSIETVYEHIKNMFSNSGYTPPKFIFWNLSTDHKETFPVNCDTDGVVLVSGFSEQLLKILMNYDEINPEKMVDEILEPYIKKIIISDEDI